MKQTNIILGDSAYYEALRKRDALAEQLKLYQEHSRERVRMYKRLLASADELVAVHAKRLQVAAGEAGAALAEQQQATVQ